jgi:hypothetical protein
VQENCLVFRGPSAKAQRGLPDPANVTGSDPAFEHAVRGEYTMQKAAKMLEVLPMVGHWMWIRSSTRDAGSDLDEVQAQGIELDGAPC